MSRRRRRADPGASSAWRGRLSGDLASRWPTSRPGVLARRQLVGSGLDAALRGPPGGSAAVGSSSAMSCVCTTTGALTPRAAHVGRRAARGTGQRHRRSHGAGTTRAEQLAPRRDHRPSAEVAQPAATRRRALRRDPTTGGLCAHRRSSDVADRAGRPAVRRLRPRARVRRSGSLAAVVQQRLDDPRPAPRRDRAACSRCAAPSRSSATLEHDRRRSALPGRASASSALCREHGLPLPDRQTRQTRRLRARSLHRLPSGGCLAVGVVILEIDGGFHMEVEHWEDDMVRERDLVATGCRRTAVHRRELRDEPDRVAASLRAVGVGESSA